MSRKQKKGMHRYIPYVQGFTPPSKRAQITAVGCKDLKPPEYCVESMSGKTFFKPIPQPTSIDDWLAQYNEGGQSYNDFIRECPWLSSRKVKYMKDPFVRIGNTILEKYPNKKIYLMPIGEFDSNNSPYFNDLIDFAQRFLCITIAQTPAITIEQKDGEVYWVDNPHAKLQQNKDKLRTSQRIKHHKLKSRYDVKSNHRQICVDSDLLAMKSSIPDDALCIVGLTMSDLYADDTDLFVAGMAAGNHRVGVFSFYRYDPTLSFSTEFWHQITQDKSLCSEEEKRKLLLIRSCRLLVHEIGHLLGIGHCVYFDCCMNGSGHLAEDFRQSNFLCPVDLHKLQTLCGFDIVKRYEDLLAFYEKHGFMKEVDWLKERLAFINESK